MISAILAALGFFSKLMPFIRWVASIFMKTDAEKQAEIEKKTQDENDAFKKSGRPKP